LDNWKQAFWLMKFELKKSFSAIVLLMLMTIFSIYFFKMFFEFYRDTGIIIYELFFLIVFGIAAIWAKPKEFQYQKINDRTWGHPYFMTLSQLPINRDILVHSRFLIYYLYSIPFHVLVLLFGYLFTPALQEMINIPSYMVFSLIWLSYGITIGSVFPAVDAGDYITMLRSVLTTIPLFFGIVVALILIQRWTGDGIVTWTIIAANEWPILSTLVSLLVAGGSTMYWRRNMKNRIRKVDYL